MESAIMSLISMAIILVGTLVMAQGTLDSVDATSASWQQAEKRMGEVRRTDVDSVSVVLQPGNTVLDITLGNQGEVALNDFPRWDVVVQYRGADDNYYIKRLPHTSADPPGDNQWTVTGIFLDAQASNPEIFEPGILNPEEEAVLQIKLNPVVKSGSTNRVNVTTPNGVVTAMTFNG